MTKHAHLKYRPDIDGLRTLAVMPVILFHAGFQIFSGGFVGVDVFFVISGYLITTILLSELEQGNFSIVNFYERRARRILPALFFVMACSLPFAWLWLLPQDMLSFSQSLIAVSLFGSNILFWRTSGYFDTATELKPLLHTWSLSVEEQYYVFFPLLLLLAWRLGKKLIGVSIVLIAFASLLLAQYLSATKPMAAFYLLPTRAWELMIGALVAFYYTEHNINRHKPMHSQLGGLLGFALICYSIFSYDKQTPFPSIYALAPTAGAALIIAFNTKHTLVGRLLGSKPFVGIGLISYSAYLWHQPIFAFAKYLFSTEPSRPVMAILVVISIAVAWLTWRFLERPFRNQRKLSRQTIFITSAVFSAFFIFIGFSGHQSDGFKNRDSMRMYDDLDWNIQKLGYIPCKKELTENEPKLNFCYGETLKPNAMLVGDSHAEDKFYGISRNIKGYQWQLVANASCPPLKDVYTVSVDKTECYQRYIKIFDYLKTATEVKLVVLSFSHAYPLDKLIAADHVARKFRVEDEVIVDQTNKQLNKIDAFYGGLDRTVAFLEQLGKQVVVLVDVPELTYFPKDCLRAKDMCEFNRMDVLNRQVVHRDRLEELKRHHPNLAIYDPLEQYCHGAMCNIIIDGRTAYRDSHHLSLYGSDVYGHTFADWLAVQKFDGARPHAPRSQLASTAFPNTVGSR